MRDEIFEELGEDMDGLVDLRHNRRGGVDGLEQERAQLVHGGPDVVAQADVALVHRGLDHIDDERLDTARVIAPEQGMRTLRKLRFLENACPDRVVDIMVHVGDAIGDGDDAAFERLRALLPRMAHDAVAHLRREVQAATATLDDLEDAQALLVVAEETGRARVIRRHAPMTCDARAQSALPRVAERRMPQVVAIPGSITPNRWIL